MEIFLPLFILGIVFFLYINRRNNLKLAEHNRKAGAAFLITNGQKDGIAETSSGLQYEVITKGTNDSFPSARSTVKVHYHGTLIDGAIFDSSVDRGEPIEFGLNQVIKGWTEGLQLMSVGDKFRFFIPANLAYGNGSAGIITPGSVLIFEVELLDFSN